MPLHFPRCPDVRLRNAPLVEVICQVRYSPILRILRDPPSEFQEEIRGRFPQFEMSTEVEGPGHLYRFRTADGQTTITLGPDAYSLATGQYTVWEDFAKDIVRIHEAIQRVYQIPFYNRIGLRYVNLFTTSNTGGETLTHISEVLRPEFSPLLRVDAWTDPSELVTQLLLEDTQGKLIMRIGAKADADDGGPVVFLDLDFFEEGQLAVDGLLDRCKRYHDVIYDAFRWSLKEDRLVVFEPSAGGGGR